MYVVDEMEKVFVVPDGPHRHPEVLGNGRPALYAGEIGLNANGMIIEMNNLSGTFRFQSADGLRCLAGKLKAHGFALDPFALTFYDPAGSAAPTMVSLP